MSNIPYCWKSHVAAHSLYGPTLGILVHVHIALANNVIAYVQNHSFLRCLHIQIIKEDADTDQPIMRDICAYDISTKISIKLCFIVNIYFAMSCFAIL